MFNNLVKHGQFYGNEKADYVSALQVTQRAHSRAHALISASLICQIRAAKAVNA